MVGPAQTCAAVGSVLLMVAWAVWGSTSAVLAALGSGTAELTPAEVARSAAFLHDGSRDDYVAAHLLVREVARQAGLAPSGARLRVVQRCATCSGHHGQPRLPDVPDVRVSLSHSSGAVLAAAATSAVGVDLEPVDALRAHEVGPVLDPLEDQYLRAAPASETVRAWCRKESAVKASGRGIEHMAEVRTFDERGPRPRWDGLRWTERRSRGFFLCVAHEDPASIRSIEDEG